MLDTKRFALTSFCICLMTAVMLCACDESNAQQTNESGLYIVPESPPCVDGMVEGSIRLKTPEHVLNLAECRHIEGDLVIDCPACTSLHGVENLETVTQYIGTFSCEKLTSLKELSNVRGHVESIHIDGCPRLENLSGLQNISSAARVWIRDNNALKTLEGLDRLTDVAQYLYILSNHSLESVEGLKNLTGTFAENIMIEANHELQDLDGLENITSVDGALIIDENNNLQSLAGLKNLTRIENGLVLSRNPALKSLEGLSALREIGGLELWGQPGIEDLTALSNVLRIGSVRLIRTAVLRLSGNFSF